MGICRFAPDVTSKERVEDVYLGYGSVKNHKKTVKNGQARTRESEEYKKKPKIQSRSQEKSSLRSHSSALQPNGRDSSVKSRAIIGLLKYRAHAAMKEAQIHMGFCTKSLTKEAQCHIKGMPAWQSSDVHKSIQRL
ncbi:hypothetical protein Tco_1209355 [Tanacetum coccineum]